MTLNSEPHVPVLIAGAGPVGLGLAIELGRLGVECLVAEKRDGVLRVPKMSAVSTRNMEFCRRWDIAREVRDAVWPADRPHDFVYAESLNGAELGRLPMPSYADRGDTPISPEATSHCPQIFFDPILAARAKALPAVTLAYETELAGLEQDSDGVRATLADLSGGRRSVTAAFLVGCDGAGGFVREALGIPLDGEGPLAASVNIFFRSAGLVERHDKGWARFYRLFDADSCWAELIPIDGECLWRLTVFDSRGAHFDTPGAMIKMMGEEFPYEVIDVSPWERRDFVARRYRDGRIFIAGDAAHQCSPTGGLGMHTGLGEATNLAWKLDAVLAGWGGPALLDSYEAECQPVAARNVAMGTLAFRNISALPGRGDAPGALAADSRSLTRLSVSETDKTQICYENSPVCITDGTPPPDTPEWGAYVPSARPGTRAPHGWLADGRSTLDLFGDGFTLLRFTPAGAAADAAALQAAAGEAGMPVIEVAVGDPALAEIYGAALVLVRPDGHVAWRGDHLPADARGLVDRVRGAATA